MRQMPFASDLPAAAAAAAKSLQSCPPANLEKPHGCVSVGKGRG